MFNIVLHEPGIALNTGNIGRTCVAAGASLHLIRPFGFRLNEKEIKRSGMDYWEKLDVHEYVDYEDFCERYLAEGLYPYVEDCSDITKRNAEPSPYILNRESNDAEQDAATQKTAVQTESVQKIAVRNTYNNSGSAGSKQNMLNTKPRIWYATTKAKLVYTEADFRPGDFIMFGNESRGIPEEILTEHEETCIRIPMFGEIRSLNLANSAAIVLYEALRQNGFGELNREGHLHRLNWKSEKM